MTAPFTYWKDEKDGLWVGYWNEYPDYPTQGRTLDELKRMLLEVRGLVSDGTLDASCRKDVGLMEFA